jgi:hypothetical protein
MSHTLCMLTARQTATLITDMRLWGSVACSALHLCLNKFC